MAYRCTLRAYVTNSRREGTYMYMCIHRREGNSKCVYRFISKEKGEHDQSAIVINFVTGVPISLLQGV